MVDRCLAAPLVGAVRWARGRTYRVLRGGSWNNNNTQNLRASNRNNNNPTNRNNNNGFRCSRDDPVPGRSSGADRAGSEPGPSWPHARAGVVPGRRVFTPVAASSPQGSDAAAGDFQHSVEDGKSSLVDTAGQVH
ncbi:MAG: SUMF1/EgtB/PvdO family nonheme iron enzyme [Deltaproteobacteria bacterium]|nr:SUMF1/EgtB/PvdO family nonheme iron enzyme [Deltaproteobacteria bacterium]